MLSDRDVEALFVFLWMGKHSLANWSVVCERLYGYCQVLELVGARDLASDAFFLYWIASARREMAFDEEVDQRYRECVA